MAENNGIFQKITAKKGMGQVFTAFGGVIVLMIIFTCMNRNFASAHNLTSLLRQICPYLLVGIGQAFVCITGNIDLCRIIHKYIRCSFGLLSYYCYIQYFRLLFCHLWRNHY